MPFEEREPQSLANDYAELKADQERYFGRDGVVDDTERALICRGQDFYVRLEQYIAAVMLALWHLNHGLQPPNKHVNRKLYELEALKANAPGVQSDQRHKRKIG